MLVCLIINGSCICAHSLKLQEKKSSGKWSERWNSPEGVQSFPVRYTALSERMVGLFFFFFLHSSRLGSIQYCSHCSYCQLSKVGGITTSTGENNTLCFIGALWVYAANKNQEMRVTLQRELVKGGTSGKSRKRKTKENKPKDIVTYCLQYKGAEVNLTYINSIECKKGQ